MISEEEIEKFRRDPKAYSKECKRLIEIGRKKLEEQEDGDML